MKPQIDTVTPGERWEFDSTVTEVFDNMLERSIPNYEIMRELVTDLSREFLTEGGTVVDLGASRGNGVASLLDGAAKADRAICVETSASMLESLAVRFDEEIAGGSVHIANCDLRYDYPVVRDVSVTLSVLTAQFIPIEHRLRLMRSIYESTRSGGALIFVEKVLGENHMINELMVKRYHQLKNVNGYSREAIQQKARSLEGVLVPMSGSTNVHMLSQAGFTSIDCFWRWMNFAGYLAVKGTA